MKIIFGFIALIGLIGVIRYWPAREPACPAPKFKRAPYWNDGSGFKDIIYCSTDGRVLGQVFAGSIFPNETTSVCLGNGSCLHDAINEHYGVEMLLKYLADHHEIAKSEDVGYITGEKE